MARNRLCAVSRSIAPCSVSTQIQSQPTLASASAATTEGKFIHAPTAGLPSWSSAFAVFFLIGMHLLVSLPDRGRAAWRAFEHTRVPGRMEAILSRRRLGQETAPASGVGFG